MADPWLTSSHEVWVLLKQVVKRWHLQLYLCVTLQVRESRTNELGYVMVSFSIQMDWILLTRWFLSTTVCRAKLFCNCRLSQVMRFGKTWKWQDCFSYSHSVISCCLSWVVHHFLVQFLKSLISSHKIGISLISCHFTQRHFSNICCSFFKFLTTETLKWHETANSCAKPHPAFLQRCGIYHFNHWFSLPYLARLFCD